MTGRTQTTRVGSAYSESVSLASGIVQGSCLGPLLFLLYINDVVNVFDANITCKLYADDVKLYTTIRSNDDCICFQNNLDKLMSWSDKWQHKIS